MRCSFGVISRSDPRFSLLPINPTLGSATRTSTITTHPFLRLSTTATRLPRTRVSIRTKAALKDGSVAPPADTLSFYELLGISESGTLLEIKQAYKELARKYHPDVSPPDRVEEYTQAFIRVREAYETLSDPRQRALYDRDMARGLHLAFSAGRRYRNDEPMVEKSEWKTRWQAQLLELERRSMNKDARGTMSWGARMRRKRNGL